MRHWLWFKTDGEIGGEEKMTGGWDAGLDFNDATSTDDTVQQIRTWRLAEPGFQGFLSYDCPCDPSVQVCHHAESRVSDKYVDDPLGTPVLADKPLIAMYLDGVLVADADTQDKTPGWTGSLVLKEATPGSIPDGYEVNAKHAPAWVAPANILQSETLLTFNSGETAAVTVTAPAQGSVGAATFAPVSRRLANPQTLLLRGWA